MKDHFWYDPESKQMLHGRGGQMIFVYDPNLKKRVPRIIDREEMGYGSNYEEILDWVNKNPNYIREIIEKSPSSIVVDVDPNLLSSIEDELYYHKIDCDHKR